MSKKDEERINNIKNMEFILGKTQDKPDNLNNFINARSHYQDWRNLFGRKYTKAEAISFFIKHSASYRAHILKENPNLIYCLPADCKLFDVKERPSGIGWRTYSFGGRSCTFEIYLMSDILDYAYICCNSIA